MITGAIFRDALISGANLIQSQRQQIDELNVFPVPDGDTGTNMSMTIGAAARELARLPDDCTVSKAASCAASALLRGARGNSGVILSLIFRGFSKGLADCETATTKDLARGLMLGTESAYKAVMKPTEGTILTVVRMTAKKAQTAAEKEEEILPFWETVCKTSKEALAKTPEILPVLKKAGVVDAGGKGLTVIFDGMLSVFRDGTIVSAESGQTAAAPKQEASLSEMEEEINFTYCTEFIVKRHDPKKDPLSLRAYLESIGDCVVVVDDESIIKVHVHTDNPGRAIQQGIKYGMLTNIKIENMREQFENRLSEKSDAKPQQPDYAPVDPDVPYGFVSVCAGDGVAQLFSDLGVDRTVSGGQTMNPSTEDILAAIQSVPAKTVFVLPNNKNIIMAAEQAIPLADREVRVLHTRTIPQGLSAMLCFDPEADASQNQIEMTRAAENVGSGQITFAARDSDYEGHKIKEGELLALEGSRLSFVEKDLDRAAIRLTRNLLKKTSSFVTILYGEGVTQEQAEIMVEALRLKIPENIDVSLVNGGQPVYYYIISVE